MNCRPQRRLVNCRSGHAHRCRWLKWLAFQIWRDIDTGFTWATTVTRERRLSFGMTRAQPKPSTRKILDHPPVSNLKGQTRSVLSIMTGYNVARDIFQPRNFRSFNTNSPSLFHVILCVGVKENFCWKGASFLAKRYREHPHECWDCI